MIAIKTENLCKNFKNKKAVRNLNLEINEGELFSLLGVNGAGKSTTIKMLTCVLKPTSGDAFILNKSITKDTFEVKRLTNVSPQETAIAPMLSVEENLVFIARVYGLNKKDANSMANKMMEELHLIDERNTKAGKLSGGMQRRLSIAMALISNPKVLFLDEPTLGLDVLARRELWRLIEQLKGKITIILTTHYLEEAEALSDRIGIMEHGILKEVGTSKELINKTGCKNFEDAFVKIASQED